GGGRWDRPIGAWRADQPEDQAEGRDDDDAGMPAPCAGWRPLEVCHDPRLDLEIRGLRSPPILATTAAHETGRSSEFSQKGMTPTAAPGRRGEPGVPAPGYAGYPAGARLYLAKEGSAPPACLADCGSGRVPRAGPGYPATPGRAPTAGVPAVGGIH